MKKYFGIFLFLAVTTASAQIKDTVQLQETVVTASRWNQKIQTVPARVIGITAKTNAFQNNQTSADLLQNTGQVFVQKSQTGGGSAVLRGFETNRVLMVIDGIRLNNAAYRGGHIQDVITIDNAILSKTEILFGPSSTLYGSDAIGGVIHFFTKNPELGKLGVNAFIRYSTANNEKTGHLDFNLGTGKLASLSSVTYSDFGDLRTGNRFDAKYGDWGKNLKYVTRDYAANADVVNVNQKPNVMVGSGYKQIDLLEKVLFKQSGNVSHTLNFQYSTNIGNLPRYDRLLELSNGNPTYAQWDYGPQTRFLGAYTLQLKAQSGIYDDAKFILSYQAQDQDRISRKRNNAFRRSQMEDISVFSANFDLTKQLNQSTILYYGLEEALNTVNSSATNVDIVTGAAGKPAATRYPDGGNLWNSAAVYAQANKKIDNIFSLTGGLRLTAVQLRSKFKNDRNAGNAIFPYDKVSLSKVAPAGNLSLVANFPSGTKLSATASTGFRAPNVDDMVKFFDNTSNSSVVVPNTGLKPEYAYNGEFNVSHKFGELASIESGVYFTYLDNALTVRPTTFNGQDSVAVDGAKLKALSVQNANSGWLWGFYLDAKVSPVKGLNFRGSISSAYGKYKDGGEVVPLDHVPPAFGKLSVDYTTNKLQLEAFLRFSAAKRLKDYSPSGEDNLSQTPLVNGSYAGTPAWQTLNFRAGYEFTKNVSVNAGLENILDKHYRQFASGVSAPGRNLYVSLRFTL